MRSDNDRDNIWNLYNSKSEKVEEPLEVIREQIEPVQIDEEFDYDQYVLQEQNKLNYKFDDGTVIFYDRKVVNVEVGRIVPSNNGIIDQDTIEVSPDNKTVTASVYYPSEGETYGVIFRIKDGREINKILLPATEMLAPLGAAGTTPQGGSVNTVRKIKPRRT